MKKRPKKAGRKRSAPKRTKSPAGDGLRVVFSADKIRGRVKQLAGQVDRDYKGRTLHVVGILENCFLFMADLVRHLKTPVICQFIKAEMHDSKAGAVAVREIVYTPKIEVNGKDILLVDGILQSGVTLDHLYRMMLAQEASSVRIATLIEKTDERKVDIPTAYVGFKTEEKFLVGYGLGYQEKYRNLPFVARLG